MSLSTEEKLYEKLKESYKKNNCGGEMIINDRFTNSFDEACRIFTALKKDNLSNGHLFVFAGSYSIFPKLIDPDQNGIVSIFTKKGQLFLKAWKNLKILKPSLDTFKLSGLRGRSLISKATESLQTFYNGLYLPYSYDEIREWIFIRITENLSIYSRSLNSFFDASKNSLNLKECYCQDNASNHYENKIGNEKREETFIGYHLCNNNQFLTKDFLFKPTKKLEDGFHFDYVIIFKNNPSDELIKKISKSFAEKIKITQKNEKGFYFGLFYEGIVDDCFFIDNILESY